MTVFALILGLLFLTAGGAKIAGAAPLAEQFGEFGLSLRMMRLIGILEVAAAVALQFDPLRLLAAIGLILLMIGAVANHLRVKHPPDKSAPAAVLGIALVAFTALLL